MATSLDRNAPLNRPKKSDKQKIRRRKQHEKRLTALGLDPAKHFKLNTKEIRALIRHPVKTAKNAAIATARAAAKKTA